MFLGITLVNSPVGVAMPIDKGVTSDDVISFTAPERMPPYNDSNTIALMVTTLHGWIPEWQRQVLQPCLGPPDYLEKFQRTLGLFVAPDNSKDIIALYISAAIAIPAAFESFHL